MKTIIPFLLSIFFAGNSVKAQKAGDFIIALFDTSTQLYYARVLSVENNVITANFVHSNSVYKISNGIKNDDESAMSFKAQVISNVGGKYTAGTLVYYSVVSRKEQITSANPCDSKFAILEFQDGKEYLAIGNIINGAEYFFTIMHSNKEYTINVDSKKIVSSDGTYKAGGYLKSMYCTNYSMKQK